MRTVTVVLVLVLLAGVAWAEDVEGYNQVNAGLFFPTDIPSGIDANTGLALNYTHLNRSGWYAGAEMTFYTIDVLWESATVTTWAVMGGPILWQPHGRAYMGAGIGLSQASAEVAGYTVSSDTKLAWELIAGMVGEPLGVQVRYRDGGVPANTGVSAALSYTF